MVRVGTRVALPVCRVTNDLNRRHCVNAKAKSIAKVNCFGLIFHSNIFLNPIFIVL